MPHELLSRALEQAERSEPAVRAAALMRIARVLARSDREAAQELLERGIGLAEELDKESASLLLHNAIYLAAAVSPKHAIRLYADHRQANPFGSEVVGLVNAMAQHGHIADVVAYFDNPLPGDRFPLHFVNNLARECADDENRLRLLRLAGQAWNEPNPSDSDPHQRFARPAFISLFSRYWSLLPRDEARLLLKDVLHWALELKAEPCRLPLTNNPDDPELGSDKESLLFSLLPAVKSLEPELERRVLGEHPQLAAAWRRFPLGMESVWAEHRPFDLDRDDAMTVGNSEVMPMSEALASDFDAAFQEAQQRFQNDTDPENWNRAPKECWPSAWEFRNILFKAGQHIGWAAEKYLERIPDADIRLLSQIEICAAVEGLPQIGGVTSYRSAKPQEGNIWTAFSPGELEEIFGPEMNGIHCPKCKWIPRAKSLWTCKCGHHWNTFDTRGRCPQCSHQWEVTACIACGVMSPHEDWYVQP